MSATFWQGFWRLADPKISLASFAGLFLGAALAASGQALDWPWLLLTIVGVFCVEVAKNASGEVVDYDSGTDLAITENERSPFSGGKRVMVEGLLTRSETWQIAMAFYGMAILIGLLIVLLRDAKVLYLGLAGMALAWFYHGGRLKLSYRGLGELAVAIAYGPLVVCGTYLVQTGNVTAAVVQASIALGILVCAFLWINEFPDYRADRDAGKRNLVVRLGIQRAAFCYVVILCTGHLWLALTAFSFPSAAGLAWGLLATPLALFSGWRLLGADGRAADLIPAQVASLGNFVLTALCAGLGVLFSA